MLGSYEVYCSTGFSPETVLYPVTHTHTYSRFSKKAHWSGVRFGNDMQSA
uniref:Uncharacterized protein n=1 Tax=Anguilla anguilla TaxID=7936 RepID=A0A0E9V637_ANGAN